MGWFKKHESIQEAENRVLEAMKHVAPDSAEHARLSTELEKIERARVNRYSGGIQAICSIGSTTLSGVLSALNIAAIIRNENKGNLTPKTVAYAPKPKEYNYPGGIKPQK